MSDVETAIVEVTPLFYNRETMSKAASFVNNSKETITFAWVRIELERGQSAEIKTRTTVKQNKVELPSQFVKTAGFYALEKAGMIRIIEGDITKPVLTDDQFETFWNRMPYRLVSGRKTRGSKSNAKRKFHRFIRTQEQFDNLLLACDNYAVVANKFPKDAERFLNNNFYADFIPEVIADGVPVRGAEAVERSRAERERIEAERQKSLQTS